MAKKDGNMSEVFKNAMWVYKVDPVTLKFKFFLYIGKIKNPITKGKYRLYGDSNKAYIVFPASKDQSVLLQHKLLLIDYIKEKIKQKLYNDNKRLEGLNMEAFQTKTQIEKDKV